MTDFKILQGAVPGKLIEIPSESIQTVVTSPPYFGLRDYGLAEWLGGDPECDHRGRSQTSSASTLANWKGGGGTRYKEETGGMPFVGACPKCGAVRANPHIWGGEPDCEHSFEDQTKRSGGAYKPGSKKRWQHSADDFGRDDRFLDGHPHIPAGELCSKCGAWCGDLGLEPTPWLFVRNMVDVFREVWRVLRPDGTLWLNLGDSYANDGKWGGSTGGKHASGVHGSNGNGRGRQFTGLKGKDLMGMPWSVAKALQAPYYAGRMKDERDRVWMAAIIDGEGTICGFDHTRERDGSVRTGVHIFITNSSIPLLDEADRIWPASRAERLKASAGHLGKLQCYRWIVNGIENKMLFLREIYPYLIAKKKQAILAYNLLMIMAESKRMGPSPQRDAVRERRSLLVQLMSDANKVRPFEVPSWCVEPPSLHEPGWYLRQDIIWSKPNPMPESVTDRCTKAHEYMFLLTKSPKYYFDAEAIKEPVSGSTVERMQQDVESQSGSLRANAGNKRDGRPMLAVGNGETRNKRSVWSVATQPYSEAHFATFPPRLIEPCILAGTSARGGCPTCGKAWDRVTRTLPYTADKMPDGWDTGPGHHNSFHREGREKGVKRDRTVGNRNGEGESTLDDEIPQTETLGWKPGCKCAGLAIIGKYPQCPPVKKRTPERMAEYEAEVKAWEEKWHVMSQLYEAEETVPQTVLDPFSGSGTTVMVATQHKRASIGVELNPEYIEISMLRLKEIQMELF